MQFLFSYMVAKSVLPTQSPKILDHDLNQYFGELLKFNSIEETEKSEVYQKIKPTVERILNAVFDPNEWMDDKMNLVLARTLVLWGREDGLLPVEFAEQYAKGIPDARLEIFEQCGHVPQIERALEFNRLISEFLD